MTLEEQIETLDIFIESANEIKESNFLKQASNGGISTSISSTKEGTLVFERCGPEHDAVKALLLTIRFFYQDNETSIRKVAEMIADLTVTESLKKQFVTSRENFNAFLDKAPRIGFSEDIGAKNNRAIFETFLYGTFVHANRDKRRRLKSWMKQPYFDSLRSIFDVILVEFVGAVSAMSGTCQKIHDELVTQQ